MESFEKKGIWWIPGQEAAEVAGILSFTEEDGLHLDLFGAFRDDLSTPFTILPVLFGHADEMGMITLGHCLPAGTRMSIPGPMYEAYRPSIAFAGAHIADPLTQRFHKTRLTFRHLLEWVHEGGISATFARQLNAATPIKAEYTHPEEKHASLSFGTLKIRFTGRTSGDLLNSFTISQGVHIDLEPLDPLPVHDLLETLVSPMQAFLTFATERAANITTLTLFSDDLLIDLGNGRTQRAPIQVYMTTRHGHEEADRRLFNHDFLFTLSDVEKRFEQVIEKWFSFYADTPHCANLLVATHYSPRLHLDRVFLTLAQVSEIFHRSRFKRTKLPPTEFSRRMTLIDKRAPPELAAWIKDQASNELSFAQRLEELVRYYGECVLPLRSDPQEFIRSVVDTRNFYTHYSSGLKKKAAKGKELYLLSQALSTLVRGCLLAELGVSAKERRKLFLRNQAFLSLLQESKNSEARDLFTSAGTQERNAKILAAYESGRMTQKRIAALVGLAPSSVSRIVKSGRALRSADAR